MYKKLKDPLGNVNAVQKLTNNDDFIFIPLAADNTDYANFKAQILNDEAQLQDAEGSLMTPEDAKDFVRALP